MLTISFQDEQTVSICQLKRELSSFKSESDVQKESLRQAGEDSNKFFEDTSKLQIKIVELSQDLASKNQEIEASKSEILQITALFDDMKCKFKELSCENESLDRNVKMLECDITAFLFENCDIQDSCDLSCAKKYISELKLCNADLKASIRDYLTKTSDLKHSTKELKSALAHIKQWYAKGVSDFKLDFEEMKGLLLSQQNVTVALGEKVSEYEQEVEKLSLDITELRSTLEEKDLQCKQQAREIDILHEGQTVKGEEFESRMKSLLDEISDLEHWCSDLKSQKERLIAELKVKDEKCSDLDNIIQDLHLQVLEIKERNSSAMKEKDTEISNIQVELERIMDEKEVSLATLTGNVESIRNELTKSEARIAEYDSEILHLKSMLAEERRDKELLNEQMKTLEYSVFMKEDERKQLQIELDQKCYECHQQQDTFKTLSQEIDTLNSSLIEKCKNIQSLHDFHSDLETQLSTLHDQKHGLEEQCNAYLQKIQEMELIHQQLRDDANSNGKIHESALNDVKAELKKVLEELAQIKEKKSSSDMQFAELQQQNKQLEEEKDALNLQVSDIQHECNVMHEKLSEKQHECDIMHEKVSSFQSTVSEIQSKYDKVKEEKVVVDQKLTESGKEIGVLSQDFQNLEKVINGMESRIETFQGNEHEYAKMKKDLERQLCEQHERFLEAEEMLKRKNDDITHYIDMMDKLSKEKNENEGKLNGHIHELSECISSLKEDNTKLSSDLESMKEKLNFEREDFELKILEHRQYISSVESSKEECLLKISVLENEKERLCARLDEMLEENSKQRNNVATLDEEIYKKATVVEELESKLISMSEKLNHCEICLRDEKELTLSKDIENCSLNSLILEERNKSAEIKSILQSKEQELKIMSDSHEQFRSQHSLSVDENIQELKRRDCEMNQLIKKHEAEIKSMSELNCSLEDKINEMNQMIKKHEAEIKSMSGLNCSLEDKIKYSVKENEVLLASISKLEREIETVRCEKTEVLEMCESESSQLKEKNEHYLNSLSELQSKFVTVKAKNELFQKEMASKDNENAKLLDRIKDLENSLSCQSAKTSLLDTEKSKLLNEASNLKEMLEQSNVCHEKNLESKCQEIQKLQIALTDEVCLRKELENNLDQKEIFLMKCEDNHSKEIEGKLEEIAILTKTIDNYAGKYSSVINGIKQMVRCFINDIESKVGLIDEFFSINSSSVSESDLKSVELKKTSMEWTSEISDFECDFSTLKQLIEKILTDEISFMNETKSLKDQVSQLKNVLSLTSRETVDLQLKYDDLCQKLVSFKTECDSLYHEKAAIEELQRDILKQFDDTSLKLESVIDECSSIKKLSLESDSKITSLETELTKCRSEKECLKSSFDIERSRLEALLRSLEDELTNLQEDNVDCHKKINKYETQVEEANIECRSLKMKLDEEKLVNKEKIHELQERFENATVRLEHAQGKLASTLEQLKVKDTDLDCLTDKVNELNTELQDAKHKLYELEESMKEKIENIVVLENENDMLKKSYAEEKSSYESDISCKNTDIENFICQILQLEENNENVEAKFTSCESELNKIKILQRQDRAVFDTKMEALSKEIYNKNTAINNLESDIAKLELNLKEYEAQIRAVVDDKSQLLTTLSDQKQDFNKLEVFYKEKKLSMETSLEDKCREIDKLNEKVKLLTSDLESSYCLANRKETIIEELQKSLVEEKNKFEVAMKASVLDLEEKIKGIVEIEENYAKMINEKNQENDRANKKILSFENEMKLLKNKVTEQTDKICHLNKKVSELSQENEIKEKMCENFKLEAETFHSELTRTKQSLKDMVEKNEILLTQLCNLEDENKTIGKEIALISHEKNASAQNCNKLEALVAKTQYNLADVEKQKNNLEKKLSELTEIYETVKKLSEEKDNSLAKLEQSLLAIREELQETKISAEMRLQEKNILKEDMEVLGRELRKDLENVHKEKVARENECLQKERDMQVVLSKLEILDAHILTKEEQIYSLKAAIGQLQFSCNQFQHQKDDLEEEIKQLKLWNRELVKTDHELRDENLKLSENIDEMTGYVDELQHRLQSASNVIENLEKKLENMSSELAYTKICHEKVLSDVEWKVNQISELKKMFSDLEISHQSLNVEFAQKQRLLQQAEKEVECKNAKIESYKQTLMVKEKELTDMIALKSSKEVCFASKEEQLMKELSEKEAFEKKFEISEERFAKALDEIDSLKDIKKHLETEVEDALRKIEELNLGKQKLNLELATCERELSAVKLDLEQKNSDYTSVLNVKLVFEKKVEEKELEIEKQLEEIEDLKDTTEVTAKQCRDLNITISELQNQKHALEEENKNLKGCIENITSKINTLSTELSSKEQDIERMEDEKSNGLLEFEKQNEMIKSLNQIILERDNEISNLVNNVHELESNLSKVKEQRDLKIELLSENVNELVSQMEVCNTQRNTLQSKLADALSNLRNTEAARDELENRLGSLNQNFEETADKLASEQERYRILNNDFDELQINSTDLEKTLGDKNCQLESLSLEKQDLLLKCSKCDQELEKKVNALYLCEEKLSQLQAKVETKDFELNTVSLDKEALDRNLLVAKQKESDLSEKLELSNAKIKQMEIEAEASSMRVSDLQEALSNSKCIRKDLYNQIKEKDVQLDLLKDEIEKLSEELYSFSEVIQKMKKDASACEGTITRLEERLDEAEVKETDLKQILDRYANDIESLQKENDMLKTELERSKTDFQRVQLDLNEAVKEQKTVKDLLMQKELENQELNLTFKTQIELLEQQITDFSEETYSTRSENVRLQGEIVLEYKKNDKLLQDIDGISNEKAEMEKQLLEQFEWVNEFKAKCEEKERYIKQCDKLIQEKDKKIFDLDKQNVMLNDSYRTVQEEYRITLEKLDNTLKDKQNSEDNFKREQEESQIEFKQRLEILENCAMKLEVALEENKSLNEEIETRRKECQILQAQLGNAELKSLGKIVSLETEKDSLNAKIEELQNEVTKVEILKDSHLKLTKSLHESQSASVSHINALEEEIQLLLNEVDRKEEENQLITKMLISLESNYENSTADLRDLHDKLTDREKSLEIFTESLRELQLVNDGLHELLELSKKEMDEKEEHQQRELEKMKGYILNCDSSIETHLKSISRLSQNVLGKDEEINRLLICLKELQLVHEECQEEVALKKEELLILQCAVTDIQNKSVSEKAVLSHLLLQVQTFKKTLSDLIEKTTLKENENLENQETIQKLKLFVENSVEENKHLQVELLEKTEQFEMIEEKFKNLRIQYESEKLNMDKNEKVIETMKESLEELNLEFYNAKQSAAVLEANYDRLISEKEVIENEFTQYKIKSSCSTKEKELGIRALVVDLEQSQSECGEAIEQKEQMELEESSPSEEKSDLLDEPHGQNGELRNQCKQLNPEIYHVGEDLRLGREITFGKEAGVLQEDCFLLHEEMNSVEELTHVSTI